VTVFPSPNHGERKAGAIPRLIVLHYTGLPDYAISRAWLCDPAREVSAHWLLAEDGRAEPLVDETRRAWHAGAGAWGDVTDVNSASIGIELQNPGDRPFPAPQMAGLEQLLADIVARWSIPPAGVIGHSDMAPTRKRDPGPRFDWRRLARQGLSIWPDAPGDPDAPLADSLTAIGYPDAPPEARLTAFRLRFRPFAQGAETAGDRAMADAVARMGESPILRVPNS
jgi:N-acetylmuramoyl-L-alanine amidase